MTVSLTVSTLFYVCIALFILLVCVWLYARNTNKRLVKSIKLINDLYKLSQNQSNTISELVGEPQNSTQAKEVNEQLRPEKSAMTDHLVGITVSEVKSSISEELKRSEGRTLRAIKKNKDALEQRLLALENQTLQLQQDSPELKMYSRANLLVKQGSSIEDVMEATQLPRAEVEVLMGLHKHKKAPN